MAIRVPSFEHIKQIASQVMIFSLEISEMDHAYKANRTEFYLAVPPSLGGHPVTRISTLYWVPSYVYSIEHLN